jgi:hypothetical protein
MSSRDELLESLVTNLAPVKRAPDVRLLAAVWLLLSTACVVLFTHALGPVRPTAFAQLQAHPRFLAEMITGVITIVALGLLAFRAAIPGAVRAPLKWLVLVAGGLWVAGIAVGLVAPALEPSMLGKRDHCYLETLVYALPPLLAVLYWQGRLYPLSASRSAIVAGLAAGSLPALYIQIACMYAPSHILLYHIGPGAAVGLLAPLLLLGYRWYRASRESAGTG